MCAEAWKSASDAVRNKYMALSDAEKATFRQESLAFQEAKTAAWGEAWGEERVPLQQCTLLMLLSTLALEERSLHNHV